MVGSPVLIGTMAYDLPESLTITRQGHIAVLTLTRVAKRNALDGPTVRALGRFFEEPPDWTRAAVIAAEGEHFSAGLDLSELVERDAMAGVQHSRGWHRMFAAIEHGTLPVVSALKGAVVGAGLELAATTHIRVAERSTFFALPEGQRGIFVGGGAAVRVSRLIGVSRMTDLMLTGRVLDAEEGERLGLAHYLVDDGQGLAKAVALAERIAENSPVSNYAVIHALPRIAEIDPESGLMMESLMAGVAQASPEAKDRLRAFLEGRAAKVRPATSDGAAGGDR